VPRRDRCEHHTGRTQRIRDPSLYELGFRTLGHLQLFMSLGRDDSDWRAGLELHGRPFDC
jgi:hypothetical protein